MAPDWLVVDRQNPRAVEVADRLLGALPAAGSAPMPTVVIGGDGFFLRTIAQRSYRGSFLGLNAGNLGFLHNGVTDWDEAARRLAAGAYAVYDFPLLQARVWSGEGRPGVFLAMNDVYLERATGQAARLALFVDGAQVVDNLVADGLIVATALGSTAYSYSAGGSPAHPRARLLKITPICPHLPRLTAFDLPDRARVRVEVRLGARRPVRAVVDGQTRSEAITAIEVETSDQSVHLAYFDGHDFTGHLLDKIVRP